MDRPAARIALLAIFAASGISALIYEVAWMRMLAAVLGNTSYAVSAVLAAFMGGLALGSYTFGRVADQSHRPLLLFAGLEVGIGLSALLVHSGLDSVFPVYLWMQGAPDGGAVTAILAKFGLSLLLLLVPTTLMGGTLPVLTRVMVRRGGVGQGVGVLYAVNTLGATTGALVSGFYLIEALGLRGTVLVGVLINFVNGIAAWRLARNERVHKYTSPSVSTPAKETTEHIRTSLKWAVILATGVSGFAALGSEVVWTRILIFGLGSTTYAFAAMLTVFLSGLGAGALIAARLARRVRHQVQALATVQGFVAILSVVSLTLYVRYAEVLGAMAASAIEESWTGTLAIQFAVAVLALLPPTLLMGAAFPIACAAYAGGYAKLGSPVGRIYGANTLGAIGGSIAAVFVLIPLVGLQRSIVLLACANLAVSALLLFLERTGVVSGIRAALPALLGIILPWIPFSAPLHTVGPTEKLLFYREGTSSTVSVVESIDGYKKLYIDKIAVAGTDPVMMTDQKSLAHVPMLLHPGAERALTVGFGSGGASWSFTQYGRLERVDCVEIDPTVLEAASLFQECHHNVFADPRFHIILDDARSYLQAKGRTYDIISTDCTDLRYKSNALLYTREYFQLCRRRLNPGGLVVAWLPLGGLSTDNLRVALATFASLFAETSLWYMNNVPAHYVLLIGSEHPLPLDPSRVAQQLAEEGVHADLSEVGLTDPWKLLSGFLLDRDGTMRFASDASLNTDDRPILEFRVPRGGFKETITRNLLALLRERRPPKFLGASEEQAAEAGLYWRAADMLVRGHAIFVEGNHNYQGAIASYRRAAFINPRDAQIPVLIENVRATEKSKLAELQRLVELRPADAQSRNELGLLLLSQGAKAQATVEFTAAAELDPQKWQILFNLGLALESQGLLDRAEKVYRSAVERSAGSSRPHTNLGLLLLKMDDPEAALKELARAVEMSPDSAKTHYNLGLALEIVGRAEEATVRYRHALHLDPAHAGARTNLAAIKLSSNAVLEALTELDRAVAADPTYPDAHYNRGLALEMLGRHQEAEVAYRAALVHDSAHAEARNNLGILFDRAGRHDEAVSEFKAAIAARPDYAQAHNNLALALLALGQYRLAEEAASQAVILAPRMAEAHASLGLACWRRGDTVGAIRAFEDALALEPDRTEVRDLLSKLRSSL